jgi:hypothetical protein
LEWPFLNHTAKAKKRVIAALGGAAPAPLGNIAKSSSTLDHPAKAKRAERFEALSVARMWLYADATQRGVESVAKEYRTHECKWKRTGPFVELHLDRAHAAAHYGKLVTCGSVWACPICCAKIQQRRRPELVQLVEWAYRYGRQPQMITLTFPHTRFDSLADLLSKQKAAFVKFRSGREWMEFKKRYGFAGLVRSLELTHGANGWHPHTHELWVTDCLTESQREDFKHELLSRWVKCCSAVGLLDLGDAKALHAFHLHSIDVRFEVQDSDYLAKQDDGRAWGVDREIVTSSSKAGKAKGVHAHEFLVRQGKGDSLRYIEYVRAMKGKRQLFWSHGLKATCGVTDKADEVLAVEETEKADLLGVLIPEQWRLVLGNAARAKVLDAAESGGWLAVETLLEKIGASLPQLLLGDSANAVHAQLLIASTQSKPSVGFDNSYCLLVSQFPDLDSQPLVEINPRFHRGVL